MSDYSALQALIDAYITQNGNNEITGQIMNSVLNAIVDKMGTVEDSTLAEITEEIERAETAEEALAAVITTITSTYATTEALQDEASARSDADETLQSNIDSEASTRASADTALQSNIDAEETRATAAEAALAASITEGVDDIEKMSPLFHLSDNVYNPDNEVEGYNLVSGSPSADSRFKYNSEYISVSNGQYISFIAETDTSSLDGVFSITSYDSSYAYIKRDTFSGGSVVNKQLDATNLAYIRITCGINATDIMVVINDTNPSYTTLDYVAYGNYLLDSALPTDTQEAVTTNTENITLLQNNGIPDYLLDELDTVSVKALPYDSVLNFIWQSDQHVRLDNTNYPQLSLVGEVAKTGQLDFVMLGGDVVDGVAEGEEKSDLFKYMMESVKKVGLYHTPVFIAKGNHETNFNDYVLTSELDNCVTNQELYRLCFSHLLGDDVVFPDDVSYPTYFYKDFDRAKIRVVVLNSSDNISDTGTVDCNPAESFFRQEQVDWFVNYALDLSDKSDASEWAVLTMAHASIISSAYGTVNGNNIMLGIMTAFANGSTFSGNNAGTTYTDGNGDTVTIADGDQFYLAVDVDFSTQGTMEYIGHIQGHIHYDGVVVPAHMYSPNVYVVNSYPSQKTITTALAASGFESYERTSDTCDEYAFDIVAIDRTNKRWLMFRYGAGGDRIIHYDTLDLAVGDTYQLTTSLTGTTITWDAFSDGNSHISVDSDGLVTGVASTSTGYSGLIRAEDEDYNKEYWIFKVTS